MVSSQGHDKSQVQTASLGSESLNPFHSATGPASATAGPHKHNILNKLDPRIDSDLDGSKTMGGSQMNPAPASITSDSTATTSLCSNRTSTVGSIDTYTTKSSTSRDVQDDLVNLTGDSIHLNDHSTSDIRATTTGYDVVDSNDYSGVSSSSPASMFGTVAHPSPESAVSPVQIGHTIDDSAMRQKPRSQLEKESIGTPGAMARFVAEKEVVANSAPIAHVPSTGLHSQPTESHALATADHDDKGLAQISHNEIEVKDLGWNEAPDHRPAPLVGGLPNDSLWSLVRRFDMQMYHVKTIHRKPPGGLDLNISPEEEFSPDKLRANLERLYMTVIIGMMGFGKHIARLRSWGETRRTACFCAAYFSAWLMDLLMPMFLSFLLVLVVYPPSRSFLFPPAPLALVDGKTGGIQKPSAGMLGSHDSLTGAPERHQGEAVEQEAHNFVSGLAAIGLSSATGKQTQNSTQDQGGLIDSAVPDPSSVAAGASAAQKSTKKGDQTLKYDKTKEPMEVAMWTKARPIMTVLSDIADAWERFANLLSPTPPFPKNAARFRLGAILVPLIGVALLTPPELVIKGTSFISGFTFFGNPIISHGLRLLNEKIPNWMEYLDLRNSLLYGVPTHAQLTLTLLRIGEANKAPLPPPPKGDNHAPSSTPPALHGDDVPMDVSHDAVQDAIHPSADSPPSQFDKTPAKPAKHKIGSRLLGIFKKTTKVTVEASLGTDRLKAAAGSEHAKKRLGVLPGANEDLTSGPVDFKARHQGNKGYVYISTTATTPCIGFTRDTSAIDKTGSSTQAALGGTPVVPVWSIAISDIRELKKVDGLGWKVKLVVGWATDREIADGLEIVTGVGETFAITAVPLRDELFNRLIALGGQKWESW